MSVRAMAWAWEQDLSEGDKLLLMALADHADDDGKCWPGQESLGRKIGRSERTVRERLKRLEGLGVITRTPRYNGKGHRSSDMILLHLAQPDSYRQNLPAANVTAGSLSSGEPSVEPVANEDKETVQVSTTSGVPRISVDKLKVTKEEWDQAVQIIAAFNEGAGTNFSLVGTRGRPTEHLKRIVGRLRDYPEVTLEQHLETVKRNCATPWWEGRPSTVGVIYGPAAFPRCLATDRRPTQGRRFADERRTPAGEAPW